MIFFCSIFSRFSVRTSLSELLYQSFYVRKENQVISFLVTLLVTALSLLILSRLNIGLEVDDIGTAIIAALVLGLLNATLRPVLGFLAFPLTFLTLGLFAIVLNAIVLYITAALVEGFHIKNFLTAILAAVLLGILNWLIFLVIPG